MGVIERFTRDPASLLPPKRPLPWRPLLLLSLLSTVFAVGLTLLDLRNTQDTNGWLIHTSPDSAASTLIGQDFPDEPQTERGSHDGQWFYAIAKSPFDLSAASRSLDSPQYRLQRPLFAWVARAIYPPGSGAGLVWTMFGIGAASVFLGSVSLGAISATLGGSPAVALTMGLIPGTFEALRITGADTLSLALLCAALALSLRGYAVWAVVVAVLCVLAKETALVSLFGFAVWRRDRRGLALLGVPLVVAGVWALYLRRTVPYGTNTDLAFDWPFHGLSDSVRLWLQGDNTIMLLTSIVIVVVVALGLARAGLRHPLSWAVIANLVPMVLFNVVVVGFDRNGPRTAMPLLALGVALLATARTWRRSLVSEPQPAAREECPGR